MVRTALVLTMLISAAANAAIPPMKITPLGKPDAAIKGTLTRNGPEPEKMSPLNSQDLYAAYIQSYAMEGLLRLNPETNKFEPMLAEKYEVSKDNLTYTFWLDKDAKWSDGKPVTSADVKFSIEAVRDPKYQAPHRMPYFEDVESIETPDAHTVKIKMKKKYFKNLEVIGTAGYNPILPKAYYEDPKYKFPQAAIVGSGPYTVETYNRGKNISLVRNPAYWAKDKKWAKGLAKFEHVNFRFIKEENLELEMVKKGDIDYMEPVRAEVFEKKAIGEPFGTTVKKMQVENNRPKSYGFIGWNFKNPIFKDRDVRVALSHLFNRETLIQKFMYNKSVMAKGPVYYKSEFMPPEVKAIEYSPAKAKALLTKAGWADKDKNGVLEKSIDGQTREFRFSLLLPNRDVEKYFTLYKEDLKKAGIDMEIKIIEWSTFTKLLEEQKFDAVTLSWGGGSPEDDLKQIWHSDAARGGGSNFISYSNPEVDKAIDAAREEMNAAKRKTLWRKAVKLIAADAPYTYLFNSKYDLFLVNSKVGWDKPTYKYDFSIQYWFAL